MTNLTTCPYCGADIEDDSWFCDQCANQLHRCPDCGRFCKGRFCPKCGRPTQLASEAVAPQQPKPQPQTPQPQQPQQQSYRPPAPPQQPPQPIPRPTTNPGIPGTGTCIPGAGQAPAQRLVCHAMGVTLQLMPGAIVGRVNGNYAMQLGSFQYISGTQARLDFNGAQWSITDLGSRNGTAVNGVPCAPTLPFKAGDIIRFSKFYDFQVE